MAEQQGFTSEEDATTQTQKEDKKSFSEKFFGKKKTTVAEKLNVINKRLQRKVEAPDLVADQDKNSIRETGKAAGNLLGTLMGKKPQQTEEEKYAGLINKAKPYLEESINYEVSKIPVPKRSKYKTDAEYQKEMNKYEGNVAYLRQRKQQEFDQRSPVSKAQLAVEKLKAASSKRVEVENYMAKQKMQETGNNPISNFLLNAKQQENIDEQYRARSNAPSNIFARDIQELGKSQQKPVPMARPNTNFLNASNFLGGNPIEANQNFQPSPMSRPMNDYSPPQAYSQPYNQPRAPIAKQAPRPPRAPVQDLPNHRMMPPAYTAAHPWLAPDEYPPFGDNPARNFAEKNLDHPLFQTNKPKIKNPLYDEPTQQGPMW